MKNRKSGASPGLIPLLLLLLPVAGSAQVPVDDNGNLIDAQGIDPQGTGGYESFAPATGDEGIPLLDPSDLEELVGAIALYPDELLAIVLPAATYPLQIVQAARFLDDLKSDPSLEPNPEWDDSVIALVNYPEVVALLNEDLDWTWRLGEAVVAQQSDVLSAVEGFRNRAYTAGNLRSDRYQTVSDDGGIIEITPVSNEIIYVPYYEPSRVVHYQSRPVYFYYPEPCPVYYYPYPSNYIFNRGHFWGVTTAFSIGWTRRNLHVFHHSYGGHPYFGVRYWDRWWYRRPTINIHNTVYVNNRGPASESRYYHGDSWRPSRNTRLRYSDQRISRNTYVPQREAIGVTRSTFSPAYRDTTLNRTIRTPAARRPVAEPRTTTTRPRQTVATTERERTAVPHGRQLRDRAGETSRAPRRTTPSDNGTAVANSNQGRTARLPHASRQPSASSERRTRPAARREDNARPAPRREDNARPAPARERGSATENRQPAAPESRQRSPSAQQNDRRSKSDMPKRRSSRESSRRR